MCTVVQCACVREKERYRPAAAAAAAWTSMISTRLQVATAKTRKKATDFDAIIRCKNLTELICRENKLKYKS